MNNDFVDLPFTKFDIKTAKIYADELFNIYRHKPKHKNHSIVKHKGNCITGYLGEIVLSRLFRIKHEPKHDDFSNFDILYMGKRIEIKTQRRTADVDFDFDVNYAMTSEHQNPDLIAFLSMKFEHCEKINGQRFYFDLQKITLCGFYDGVDFFKHADFTPEGKVINSNKFVTKADTYHMKIHKLKPSLHGLV